MEQVNRFELSRLILCVIGEQRYCLDMSWVDTIERFDHARGFSPRTNASEPHQTVPSFNIKDVVGWLQGVDGDIPVFSLDGLLHQEPNERSSLEQPGGGQEQARIIVLRDPHPPRRQPTEAEGTAWGLLVDRVSEMIEISPEAVVHMPPITVNPQADYFSGILRHEKEWILLLSLRNLSLKVRPGPLFDQSRISRESLAEQIEDHADQPELVATVTRGNQDNGRRPARIVQFTPIGHSTGGEPISFGLSISQVPEVLDPLPMIPVPGAPDYVLGLINWRGRPIPALDMSMRLNMSSDQSKLSIPGSRLIIVRDKRARNSRGNRGWGVGKMTAISPSTGLLGAIPIHPTIRVMRLPKETPAPKRTIPMDMSLTRTVVEYQNGTLVIPDVGEMLRNPESPHHSE